LIALNEKFKNMTKRLLSLIIASLLLIGLGSCEKEVDERESDELLRLQAFLSLNYPGLEPTSSGLYCIIYDEGTGNKPVKGNYILFDYSASNLNGDVFETTSKSVAFNNDILVSKFRYAPQYMEYKSDVKKMIKGLIEGLSYLGEGGKARFIMPSSLAFGSTRYKGQHPYSSVIFDVELHRVIVDTEAYEQELIDEYLATYYPNLVIEDILKDGVYILEVIQETPDSLKEDDDEAEEEDPGPQPIEDGDVVELYYTGRLVDNWVFDTNIISVAQENNIFETNRVYNTIKITIGSTGYIEGFSIALKNLTTKTKAKVLIPSKYAYSKAGTETIPPYAPLIFELDILSKTSASGGGGNPQ
jgi:FKBP-type peptidyl-prolyl cis-trans isomerase